MGREAYGLVAGHEDGTPRSRNSEETILDKGTHVGFVGGLEAPQRCSCVFCQVVVDLMLHGDKEHSQGLSNHMRNRGIASQRGLPTMRLSLSLVLNSSAKTTSAECMGHGLLPRPFHKTLWQSAEDVVFARVKNAWQSEAIQVDMSDREMSVQEDIACTFWRSDVLSDALVTQPDVIGD